MARIVKDVARVEDLAEQLRASALQLSGYLAALFPEGSETPGRAATPQQMSGLLGELIRTGQRLRDAADLEDPAMAVALATYRQQVERLRDRLPAIRQALVEERSRIERERARLHSASQWARSSQQTL